jgi:hypothetical protein
MAQEQLIKASKIPYTIVRSTQFFEFVGGIAQLSTEGQSVRLPSALMQPIASDDVAAILADIAVGEPLNGMVGPSRTLPACPGWEPLLRRLSRLAASRPRAAGTSGPSYPRTPPEKRDKTGKRAWENLGLALLYPSCRLPADDQGSGGTPNYRGRLHGSTRITRISSKAMDL